MARKTVGYVELVWTCPRCGTKNPGPQKFCNGCGGPQPQDVQFEQRAEEKLLTDAAAIAKAKAGPDIHCPYCAARNPAGAKFCGTCGGDLAGGQARARGAVLGAHRSGPAAKVKCPACGTENPADAGRCSNCGAPLPAARRPEAAPPTSASPSRRFPIPVLAVGAVCLLLGALGLFLLVGRGKSALASVGSVHWERSVELEVYGPVEREGWRDEIPAGATRGACRLEYRTSQDRPAPVATEVCGTPYTVDEGSGYGEVVQDCVYEVYEDRCTYVVEDWSVVETLTAEGDSLDPTWPRATLSATQRFGQQTETYSVSLVSGDRTFTYRPETETAFLEFQPGSQWTIEVNALGGILAIEPAS